MPQISRILETYNENCITGDSDHLYTRLSLSMKKAGKIDIAVAFLMESGVRLLEEDFRDVLKRGVPVRLLCGNYLGITQPHALYLLRTIFGEKLDLRFYNVPGKSFHPKAYMFTYEEGGEIFLGSSNISGTALTSGIEWNYRIDSRRSHKDYWHFIRTFEDLLLNSIKADDDVLRQYSRSWKRHKLIADIEMQESRKEYNTAGSEVISFPRPMGAQIEALYELEKSRLEGWKKGIVVAATGVGKTYLAAFDSRNYERILFVAHRDEILRQAERTFKYVKPESSTGFFTGEIKNTGCDILFATVQTLGNPDYLNDYFFSSDYFDYIVIDEFHHAVAGSYANILKHFSPEFLLGLTATPERMDNKDVFSLCDDNIIYEVRLKEAINKGWLVPFRYYGIYDYTTDYDDIDYSRGKYDKRQLEKALSAASRARLALSHYRKFSSKRALGFCSTRRHAVFMAEYFSSMGVKSCAVVSGIDFRGEEKENSCVLDRKDAVEKLVKEEINVVFSVDMFNEGLDVRQIDMVMFLRPTESTTVFLQQLGRGLRKARSKKYLNVLDFIGNYKGMVFLPHIVSGDSRKISEARSTYASGEYELPDGCYADFDLKIIDLFRIQDENLKSLKDKVTDEYYRIKELLSKRPYRLDIYRYIKDDLYNTIRNRRDLNPFRNYLSFLDSLGELNRNESILVDTIAHAFLVEIENTSMTKTYKMPVLLAFYNGGSIKLSVNENEISESFRQFYSYSTNAIDLLRHESTKDFGNWDNKKFANLARNNPVKYFAQTSSQFFNTNGGTFNLTEELQKFFDNEAFIEHFKDVIDLRTRKFYREILRNK